MWHVTIDQIAESGGTQRYMVSANMMLVHHGRLLLARRANTGFEDGKLALPSGRLDAGESLEQTAQRELHEEVSVAAADVQLIHVQHDVNDGWIRAFFKVERWQGEPRNAEPDKCSELAWVARPLPDDVARYVSHALAHVWAGRLYSTFNHDDD